MKKRRTYLLIPVLLALVAAIIAVPVFRKNGKATIPENVTVKEEEPKRWITLIYRDETEERVELSAGESFTLPFDCKEQGYYCYAWEDADGQSFRQVSETAEYPEFLYQKCAVKLSDLLIHKAYIFPDESGDYALDSPFRRRDAARLFEALLVQTGDENERFEDVDESDGAFPGAALMHRYGMIEGDMFEPDKAVTCGELLHFLSVCFPPEEKEHTFSYAEKDHVYYRDLCLAAEKGWIDPETIQPDEPMTGKDVLFMMNCILDRRPAPDSVPETAYASAVDYLPDEDLFWALIEAGVTHSCVSSDPEVWETAEVIRRLEPGMRLKGNVLYWVREDGLFAINEEVNGLLFDESGRYTSGNAELDEIVQGILDEILSEDLTQYEKLRAVYDYTLKELQYGKGGQFEKGTDDWWQEEAIRMLKTGRGNCYSFAAAFCALSRPLGYDTKVSSGSTFGSGVHGWAYILFDGEEHIFDPQSEQRGKTGSMFDVLPEKWEQFCYDPVYRPEEQTEE